MFKLAERRAATGGVYCGEDGVWLGPAELVARRAAGGYRVRPAAEIEALLAAAYPVSPDAAGCATGLRRVASYLSEGNLPLAMIAAVRLRLGEIPEDRIERLVRADTLLKAGFNPDEPRDAQGRWTEEIGSNFIFILDDLGDGQEGSAGNWTGKYGIHSPAEFLADPEAQEEALTDYLNDNIRQLRANGAFGYIGETIDGVKARFPVTKAGIIAAAHRWGPTGTAAYLDKIAANGFRSRGLKLHKSELAIETRLRTFAGARYE